MGPGRSAGAQGTRKRQKAAACRDQAAALLQRAEGLERDADLWDKGAQGERLVGAHLDALRQHGWDVLHDVRWPGRPRANIDHVAVGPGGILVVDSKNWSGNVTVRGGHLRQNGYSRERSLESVAEAGLAVGGLLELPWVLHVVPVLCTSETMTAGPQQCGEVTVLGAPDLVPWATGLQPRLTPGDVTRLARQMESALPSAAVPRPRHRRTATRPPRRTMTRRTLTRPARWSGRTSLRMLARLVLLAALVVAAPTIIQWGQDVAGDAVTSALAVPDAAARVPAPTVFDSCRSLRLVHPSGVKPRGADNTGRRIARVSTRDAALASANTALDRDGDGIVCEVTRKRARQGR